VRALGDVALWTQHHEVRLVGERGPIARWPQPGDRDGFFVVGAALDDPPRLALRRSQAPEQVVVVDVASGEIQSRIAVAADAQLAFEPTGELLFESSERGVFGYDVHGRVVVEVHLHEVASGAGGRLSFAKDGKSALSSAYRGHLARIDLRAEKVTFHESVGVVDVSLDECGERALVHEVDHRVALWDVLAGKRTRTILAVSVNSEPIASVHANHDCTRVCVAFIAGAMSTFVDDGAPTHWRLASTSSSSSRALVHAGADRVLSVDRRIARLRTLAGTRVANAKSATRACFAGGDAGRRGVGVAVVNGAIHALDASGARLIEGPANVVEIAPHSRGVLALCDDDRAVVVEL
jgi:hypothetical protein